MSKKISPKILKDIIKHKNAIAEHRDALRDIYYDLDAILESSDTALNDLEVAIDRLSQYV